MRSESQHIVETYIVIDINAIIDNGNIISYAETLSDKMWQSYYKKSENGISKIKIWYNTIARSRNLPLIDTLIIHDGICDVLDKCKCHNKICKVDDIKYLGLYMDQMLKWNVHAIHIHNKIKKTFYKFKQLNRMVILVQ